MEAFHILSRGGLKFDKEKFEADFSLFNHTKKAPDVKKQTKSFVNRDELPAELDFFKYAERGSGKRKSSGKEDGPQGKKRKVKSVEDEDMDVDGDANEVQGWDKTALRESSSNGRRQRVVAKGSNVPEHIDSFSALKDRYQVPSHILQNLAQNGYIHPTGIQSYGIPILFESRDLAAISPTGTGKTLSYLIPVLASLGAPAAGAEADMGAG
ncbi:hypothetical protein C0992_012893, partial [Termitomyces sp. T32_za158]